MYLRSLSLQGFKTFAKPTTLSFPAPTEQKKNIVAIIGPNGSGKSNVADALRWVLGEQSPRLLRGRAGQDVIFSGSDGAKRSGMAEVSAVFADVQELEGFAGGELVLTRRLYRDGESAYEVNGQAVRLSDIQLLLAQANVGQKSYAIINQGHIDQVLLASPEERKAFFDDATGVKPLHLKRHQAHIKLLRTEENLQQIDQVLQEITPRLGTLKRLVRRLGEREAIEQKLEEASIRYWGTLWCQLQNEETVIQGKRQEQQKQIEQAKKLEEETREKARLLELSLVQNNAITPSTPLKEQEVYEQALREQDLARQTLFHARTAMEVAKATQIHSWSPLPLPAIIERVEQLRDRLEQLKESAKNAPISSSDLDQILQESSQLLQRLKKPSPDAFTADPALQQALNEAQEQNQKAEQFLASAKQALQVATAQAQQSAQSATRALMNAQQDLMRAREALRQAEIADQENQIALARLQTKREALRQEWADHLSPEKTAIIESYITDTLSADSAHADMLALRRTLEQIGGIDPEIVSEFEETQKRHLFLEEQSADLISALQDTRTLVRSLDEQIAEQSAKAFHTINQHFHHYFQRLFGGGSAQLKALYASDMVSEDDAAAPPPSSVDSDPIVGVDILATPPGKTAKAIALLSGGERALASIALLCAVMRTTPSPFVLLDEVDAALDESNTWRFAEIVKEIGEHTQCLLITHNRATMEAADVLFGVSVAQDGISRLLSVQLSDVATDATTRR